MKLTIDSAGRIPLDAEAQRQLGLKPGDQIELEQRAGGWTLRPAQSQTGLVLEGNVLVHRGTCVHAEDPVDALRDDRDERFRKLTHGIPM